MEKIIILLPTRDRPSHCTRALESIEKTVESKERVKIKMWIDEDEPQLDEYLKIINDRELDIDYFEYPRIAHLGKMYNLLWKKSDGTVYQMTNDDVVYGTDDWDLRIEKELQERNDRIHMLFGNPINSTSDKKCLTHSSWYNQSPALYFLTDEVTEVLGYFVWNEPPRNFLETWVEDIFYKLYDFTKEKRIIYLDDIVIEHRSVKSGGIDIDQTFRQLEARKKMSARKFMGKSLDQQRKEEARKLHKYLEEKRDRKEVL